MLEARGNAESLFNGLTFQLCNGLSRHSEGRSGMNGENSNSVYIQCHVKRSWLEAAVQHRDADLEE